MESNNKMISLFNAVADLTLERIEKEKETNLSDETYRMISLTQSLHSSIICSAQTPQLFQVLRAPSCILGIWFEQEHLWSTYL